MPLGKGGKHKVYARGKSGMIDWFIEALVENPTIRTVDDFPTPVSETSSLSTVDDFPTPSSEAVTITTVYSWT